MAVEQVQRRATRLLEECKKMSYTERLKCLELHSLKGRRLRGEFIETYRIFNNLEGMEFQNLFSLVKSDKQEMLKERYMLNTAILTVENIHLVYELHATRNYSQHCSKIAPCINSFKNLLDSDTKISELYAA